MSSDIGMTLRQIAEKAYFRNSKKSFAGPWVIDLPEGAGLRGGEYAVATDGRSLLWALDWRPTLIDLLSDDQKEIRQRLMQLAAPSADLTLSWQGKLADLQRFCGEAVWTVPCPACKGTSAISDHVICGFCESLGHIVPDFRPGFVCETPIDLNRLACLLSAFGGEVVVRVHSDNCKLWVLSDTFRAVLMCLEPSKNPADDLFEKWQTARHFPEAHFPEAAST
jgi:hypothetical protein